MNYYRPDHPLLELTLCQERERVLEMFPHVGTFVDVNPRLSYALGAVRRTLADVVCFQLVRNGRDVVRSIYNGKMYTSRIRGTWLIPNDRSALDRWSGYSRLDKICWFWNETVSRLLKEQVGSVHLERIVSDYQYLRRHLLEPSGIDLDEDVWRALKDKRLHPSRFDLKRHLRGQPMKLKWTPEREARFMAICGETMSALGYE